MSAITVAALATAILGLCTAAIGNWLVQRWQQRNWFTQHTLEKGEKDLNELRSVIDEVLRLGDARNFRTRRVVKNLTSKDQQKFEEIRRDYDTAVVNWNDRLNAMSVRLTMYAKHAYTDRLESTIQPMFVETSEFLEKAIKARERLPAGVITDLELKLNSISGAMFQFGRDLVRLLLDRERDVYEGTLVLFSNETVELFPTWYLVKALFQPTYPLQAVSSTALNTTHPFVVRPQRSWIY